MSARALDVLVGAIEAMEKELDVLGAQRAAIESHSNIVRQSILDLRRMASEMAARRPHGSPYPPSSGAVPLPARDLLNFSAGILQVPIHGGRTSKNSSPSSTLGEENVLPPLVTLVPGPLVPNGPL